MQTGKTRQMETSLTCAFIPESKLGNTIKAGLLTCFACVAFPQNCSGIAKCTGFVETHSIG